MSSGLPHTVAMRMPGRGPLTVAIALAAVVAAGLAGADERGGERDHDNAWRAREHGSTLPLGEVLEIVGPRIDGEIIETEIEYDDGRLVYEFTYVDRGGRVRQLAVDAATGAVVEENPD